MLHSIPRWIGLFLLFPSLHLFAQSANPAPIRSANAAPLQPARPATATRSGPPAAPAQPADTALFRTIRSGDAAALRQQLEHGSDANAVFDGFSALMAAALNGTPEEMLVLLDHGAAVNYANEDRLTALWIAVPDETRTILLLDHGANPNMLSKEHYTPLVKLVNFPGTTPLFQTMVAHGADPKRAARDNSLLYWAAATNDTALVGLLLRYGFRPNDTIALGDYPINSSLSYRGFETLKMLVDNNANVNVALPPTFLTPLTGLTPLMLAALNDDEPSFYYLLSHGADVNAKCRKGYSVLMCAQQY